MEWSQCTLRAAVYMNRRIQGRLEIRPERVCELLRDVAGRWLPGRLRTTYGYGKRKIVSGQ